MQIFEVLYKFTCKFSRPGRRDWASRMTFKKSSILYRHETIDLPYSSAMRNKPLPVKQIFMSPQEHICDYDDHQDSDVPY